MSKSVTSKTIAAFCLIATAPLLAACQSTCTGDARSDNYWCARGNLKNGTYAAQTSQLQMIAYDRQAELARAKANLAQKQAELDAARSGGGDDSRIASLEAEVKALQAQIQAMMQ